MALVGNPSKPPETEKALHSCAPITQVPGITGGRPRDRPCIAKVGCWLSEDQAKGGPKQHSDHEHHASSPFAMGIPQSCRGLAGLAPPGP